MLLFSVYTICSVVLMSRAVRSLHLNYAPMLPPALAILFFFKNQTLKLIFFCVFLGIWNSPLRDELWILQTHKPIQFHKDLWIMSMNNRWPCIFVLRNLLVLYFAPNVSGFEFESWKRNTRIEHNSNGLSNNSNNNKSNTTRSSATARQQAMPATWPLISTIIAFRYFVQ